MDLAGTDDYNPAEDMVRTHSWDLGVVTDAWMRQGLPLVRYDRKMLPAPRPSVPNLTEIDQADRADHNFGQPQRVDNQL